MTSAASATGSSTDSSMRERGLTRRCKGGARSSTCNSAAALARWIEEREQMGANA